LPPSGLAASTIPFDSTAPLISVALISAADGVKAFADSAALALENARLYAEATRRRQEAEEVARFARILTETLDVATVGDRIGSLLGSDDGGFTHAVAHLPDLRSYVSSTSR
jgi:hypothetical protein